MADDLLSSVPMVSDPYSKESSKALNKQFKIKKNTKALEKAQRKFRDTISQSGGFTDALNQIIERRQPVNEQLAQAGEAFADVENPFVRADLMDRAESSVRGSRANTLGQAVAALQAQASGQEYGISNLQNTLSRKLGERDQARQFTGQQYLDQLGFQRSQAQREEDRNFQVDLLARQREENLAYQKELLPFQREQNLEAYKGQQAFDELKKIGAFTPRSSGGGSGYKPYFTQLDDGSYGAFDYGTGQWTKLGDAPGSQDFESMLVERLLGTSE